MLDFLILQNKRIIAIIMLLVTVENYKINSL